MKTNNRLTRINDEFKKEISEIIRGELKDPRVGAFTSVTKVETTSDLSYSKIFISVLGTDEAKRSALTGLKNSSGFIRKMLAERINLRKTPELIFVIDDSLEQSWHITRLLEGIKENEGSRGPEE